MDNLTLQAVEPQKIKELIALAFEGDNDLLDNLHISPGTLDQCVNNTFTFIEKNKDFYGSDIEFYQLNLGDTPIGYTVVIRNVKLPNELYSFGINKSYRTAEVKATWLKLLEEKLSLPYYIILWEKNTRAVNFFKKNGFLVEERNDLRKLIIKSD